MSDARVQAAIVEGVESDRKRVRVCEQRVKRVRSEDEMLVESERVVSLESECGLMHVQRTASRGNSGYGSSQQR